MKNLKLALTAPPVLALPYSGGHLTLNTDAYNAQIGCVFLQKQLDNKTKFIDYWSRLLTEIEQWYDKTQLECLAIVWSVDFLHPYLDVRQ